jgi:hypothetical protein
MRQHEAKVYREWQRRQGIEPASTDVAEALQHFDLPSSPSRAPSSSSRTPHESGIEVQFALKPSPERTQEEEDRLIAELQDEINVEQNMEDPLDAMQARLEKLKAVKVAPSPAGSSKTPATLPAPPIFDPYEFDLARDSDASSVDSNSDKSDASSADQSTRVKKT